MVDCHHPPPGLSSYVRVFVLSSGASDSAPWSRGSKLVYCCFYLYGFQYAVLSVFFGTAVSFPQGDHLKVCSGFVLLFGFRSAAVC